MAKAEVGDDVFGEDPTVNRLEELAANMTGKQAALFVASGSMGNLVSLLAHCNREHEVILGSKSHIHIHEQGGVASLGGIHTKVVKTQMDGTLDIEEIESSINEEDIHCARTKLICLENTWYGRVLPTSYMQEVREVADQHGLSIHLDGARLFNAAIALNVPASAITQHVDSVQFCLSKGLASPVGSMVCGTEEFIAKARRARKLVGGGWRQAGVLAACGIVSLKSMVERLAEDHANAQLLADLCSKIDGIEVQHVETNMCFLGSKIPGVSTRRLELALNEAGLLCFGEAVGIRCVTHYGIEAEQIKRAAEIVASVAQQLRNQTKVSV
jgi:threonine aldolase